MISFVLCDFALVVLRETPFFVADKIFVLRLSFGLRKLAVLGSWLLTRIFALSFLISWLSFWFDQSTFLLKAASVK